MTGARLNQDNFPVGRTPPVGDGFYFRMSAEGVPGLQEALRRAGHTNITGTIYPGAGTSALVRFESAEHFAIAQQTMDRLKAAGAHAADGYERINPRAISHEAALRTPPAVLPMQTEGRVIPTEARPSSLCR